MTQSHWSRINNSTRYFRKVDKLKGEFTFATCNIKDSFSLPTKNSEIPKSKEEVLKEVPAIGIYEPPAKISTFWGISDLVSAFAGGVNFGLWEQEKWARAQQIPTWSLSDSRQGTNVMRKAAILFKIAQPSFHHMTAGCWLIHSCSRNQ